MIDNLLPSMPLWLAGFALVVLCLLAFEAGRLIHRLVARRWPASGQQTKSDAEGYIIGAIFGLFAFIIGFTFSIASDRFDARRGWVHSEAAAITALFLRAELLDEPFRTELRSTLREYAQTRIAPDGLWDARMDRQLQRSHQLGQEVWEEARAGAYPHRDSDLGGYIVEGATEVLTVGARREVASVSYIPNRVLNLLLLYLLVSSGVLGYLSPDHAHRLRVASALLFALNSSAIVLILDLDRPRAGSITVSQAPLVDLVAGMDQIQLKTPPDRRTK